MSFKSLVILIILFGVPSMGWTGTITGSVIDKDSGAPIVSATVVLRNIETGDEIQTRADDKGRYAFNKVNEDFHSLVVHDTIYQKQTRNFIAVKNEEIKTFDFKLTPIIISSMTSASDSIATGSIKGTVLNVATNLPIPDVNIRLNDMPIGSATNQDGSFVIRNVMEGRHTLYVSHIAYENTVTDTISVERDMSTEVEIQLKIEVIE